MPGGVNDLIPDVHPGDDMKASWGQSVADNINRLNRRRSSAIEYMLSNGAGDFFGEDPQAGIMVVNQTEVAIPAFGICLIDPAGTTTAPYYIQTSIKRPDTYGSQVNALVADSSGIPANGVGYCQPFGQPWIAAYDSTDSAGSPAIGQIWGPRSGDSNLHSATGGFLIVNGFDTANHMCCVIPYPMNEFYGKNAGSRITKGTTGTINIYTGTPGSESDSGLTMTNVLARFGDIPANAMVQCRRIAGSTSNSTVYWYGVEIDVCP